MNKADGNFINAFSYKEIGNTNVLIGSYPHNEMDLASLSREKVSATLNI